MALARARRLAAMRPATPCMVRAQHLLANGHHDSLGRHHVLHAGLDLHVSV
jgi:hypothetical protein